MAAVPAEQVKLELTVVAKLSPVQRLRLMKRPVFTRRAANVTKTPGVIRRVAAVTNDVMHLFNVVHFNFFLRFNTVAVACHRLEGLPSLLAIYF